MEVIAKIGEEIAKSRITDAGETFDKAGWLLNYIIFPCAEFIGNHPWLVIGIPLGILAIRLILLLINKISPS